MTNIINNSNSGFRNSSLSENRKSTSSTGSDGKSTSTASTANSSQQSDTVDISSMSDKLHALKQKIDSTPEINSSKVESIKKQIASGEYPIDAERIASKFIDLEQLLS